VGVFLTLLASIIGSQRPSSLSSDEDADSELHPISLISLCDLEGVRELLTAVDVGIWYVGVGQIHVGTPPVAPSNFVEAGFVGTSGKSAS
jgi:hypothetical protein